MKKLLDYIFSEMLELALLTGITPCLLGVSAVVGCLVAGSSEARQDRQTSQQALKDG